MKVILSIFLLNSLIIAESKNLVEIFNLLNVAVEEISSELNRKNIKEFKLFFNNSDKYKILENRVSANFQLFLNFPNKTENTLNISIDNISVYYGNTFRSWFFSELKCEREINLQLSYIFKSTEETFANSFAVNFKDTINVDSIEMIEENGISFTLGNKPELPFFTSIFEPVLALAASIVAIFLLFSVRSN